MLMYLKMASSGISFERGKGLTQSSLRTATEDTEKNGGEENTRADCEAGAGWARPRREDHRARAARCGHGGDLYRLAADAGDDCVGGRTGRRRRDRAIHPVRRAQHDLPAAHESAARE